MKNLILGICLIFCFSCNQNTDQTFQLSGKTSGIEDGSILYLRYLLEDQIIDSATVINNSFLFKTKLPDSTVQVVLNYENSGPYRFIWLENKPMTFDASEAGFRNAIVTGSDTEQLSQELDSTQKGLSRSEVLKLDRQFVKEHPNSLVAANILAVYTTTWGKAETETLYNGFSERMKNSPYGVKIKRYLDLTNEPAIGEPFVDFEMANENGQMKKLSEAIGKVTLLEFWASWCGPCREENPNLVKTYEKYHPNGFEVFAVSHDSKKEMWLKAIETDQLPWQHVSDLQGSDNAAGLIYGINGIPDNFLIDENGVVIARNLRGEYLNQKLEELIPANPADD